MLTGQRLERKCITLPGTTSPLCAAPSHLWLLTDTVDNYLVHVRLNCQELETFWIRCHDAFAKVPGYNAISLYRVYWLVFETKETRQDIRP